MLHEYQRCRWILISSFSGLRLATMAVFTLYLGKVKQASGQHQVRTVSDEEISLQVIAESTEMTCCYEI